MSPADSPEAKSPICSSPASEPANAGWRRRGRRCRTAAASPRPRDSRTFGPRALFRNGIVALLIASLLLADGLWAKPPQRRGEFPFARKFDMGEFPAKLEWLNTRPLQLKKLRGKFVLLDFWTYCCINCIHILPELKKLEQKYPNQLVVIGVHTAKFETEKDTKNVGEAILRYEIEHPVINDPQHVLWQRLGVSSWPTIVLIDPEGNAVWGRPGEFKAETVAEVIDGALPYYRKNDLLDESPVHFELLSLEQSDTPLRFPGKVLADEAGGRLFIADSNHNRIVVTDLAGKLQEVIGSGQIGEQNGGFAEATFDHPQGMALHQEVLYVADTENHLVRRVDLRSKKVTTIAGTGEQGDIPWPGLEKLRSAERIPKRWVGPARSTAISSPWALWVHEDALYIAMAGPHQIWRMDLDGRALGPFAGNGREDIVDGKLLPDVPPALAQFGSAESSSFAQPSGLTSDGQWLYVADSEGSSIRAVPFKETEAVRTLVGTAHLPYNRLFTFGDRDGAARQTLLQHCLDVAYHEGKIYVADTYNNKLKVIQVATGETSTLAGVAQGGLSDNPPKFDEPAGLSIAAGKLYIADTNNHAIRTLLLATGQVETLQLDGVQPPAAAKPQKPDFSDADKVALPAVVAAPNDGKIRLKFALQLPQGWKLNSLAPWSCWVESSLPQGPISRAALGRKTFAKEKEEVVLAVDLPVDAPGKETLTISLPFYYCSEGGLCKVGSVVWTLPLQIGTQGKSEVVLPHRVEAQGLNLP